MTEYLTRKTTRYEYEALRATARQLRSMQERWIYREKIEPVRIELVQYWERFRPAPPAPFLNLRHWRKKAIARAFTSIEFDDIPF